MMMNGCGHVELQRGVLTSLSHNPLPQVSLAVFGDPQHFAFYIAFQLASGNAEAHVSKIVSHSKKIVHYLSTCPQLPPTTVSWLSRDLTTWMTLVGKQVRVFT